MRPQPQVVYSLSAGWILPHPRWFQHQQMPSIRAIPSPINFGFIILIKKNKCSFCHLEAIWVAKVSFDNQYHFLLGNHHEGHKQVAKRADNIAILLVSHRGCRRNTPYSHLHVPHGRCECALIHSFLQGAILRHPSIFISYKDSKEVITWHGDGTMTKTNTES